MGHTIAVMNAKGGVGKSTVVMALAETLAYRHGKTVLVIDSDSQTSMSVMLMHMSRWEELERAKRTLVDYLAAVTLGSGQTDWKDFVATRVSDVEEAHSIYLIPSHMELSLFEREISVARLQDTLETKVRALLSEARTFFDFVFIDCPPGISILTESWLRECDFYLPPTKADYLSVRGLSIIDRYRSLMPNKRFAENLGVLINQKDARIRSEDEWHKWLLSNSDNRCFHHAIPRRAYIQRAADFDANMRTFGAKYPGDAGEAISLVTEELLARVTKYAPQVAAKAQHFRLADETASVQTLTHTVGAPAVPGAAHTEHALGAIAPDPAPIQELTNVEGSTA